VLKLRDYQREAIAAVQSEWSKGIVRTAVVLPTGLGKTVIFSHLAVDDAVAHGGRVLVLVHRDELVQQALDKLHSVDPGLSLGVVKAERREVHADVVVGSVQTLARPNRRAELDRADKPISLVIVDECHHAAADSYLAILEHYGCFDRTPAAGFTATLSRSDDRGLGNVWQSVAYKRDIRYGIEHKHLSPVRGRRVSVAGLDLSRVRRSRGDWQDGSLGEALEDAKAGEVIAAAYLEHARDRQGILFAPTVSSAYQFADDLRAVGISTETITGSTPVEDRRLAYKRYRAGDVQVLANCMVLTEGFDMPQASCAVMARPTASHGLYVQMVGRVLRPFPGKADALVLDICGVTRDYRLKTLVDLDPEWRVPYDKGEPFEDEPATTAPGLERGPVLYGGETEDADLFASSRSAWLRTHAGTWFVPTKESTYFLWPENGSDLFTVGRHPGRGKAERLFYGMTLEYAMAYAEDLAEDEDPSISKRQAPWRRKGGQAGRPSPEQVQFARRLGLVFDPELVGKAELSDSISVAVASRLLDRKAS